MLQGDVLGGNRGIGLELENPMPVGALSFQQRGGSPFDALLEIRPIGLESQLPHDAAGISHRARFTWRGAHQS
jgi:hypothetical protein